LSAHFITDCSGVILAGGENRRMPVSKAFIKVNGQTIIQRTLSTYKSIFSEIAIVTNQPEQYSRFNVKLLGDIYDIGGPMTGILTSLLNAHHGWVFVAACDMPFIEEKLIQYMASLRHGYDAVIPRYRGRPEPLLALYSKKLTKSMENAILDNKRSLKDFLSSKHVNYVPLREIKKVDPEARSIINLNSPRDIKTHLEPRDVTLFYKEVEGR
jgi:molybdopterin-guanine dinucleotide biosynthesis protein A